MKHLQRIVYPFSANNGENQIKQAKIHRNKRKKREIGMNTRLNHGYSMERLTFLRYLPGGSRSTSEMSHQRIYKLFPYPASRIHKGAEKQNFL